MQQKEGAPTFCNSMDGTGESYAKWDKPVSERQMPYNLTYKKNLMKKNKLMDHHRHGNMEQTDSNQRGWGRVDNIGKKGKGLVKEHVWMTHRQEQQCGDGLWELGVGWAEEGKGEKIGTTVIE